MTLNLLPLLIAAALGLTALLIVISPLLLPRDASISLSPEALADATERESLARQSLRDIDFDYRLGNLDASDYAHLRATYERRALAALRARYQRDRDLDAQIDSQLAALRSADAKRGSARVVAQPSAKRPSASTASGAASRSRRRRGASS